MKPYLDTNFITRLYLEMPESAQAGQRLKRFSNAGFPMTWLLRLETINAFQQFVYLGRKGQTGITTEQGLAAYTSFLEDLREGFYIQEEVQGAELMELFEEMSLRHTAKHGFRTYDLLHVAFAITLKCTHFHSFDQRAKKLAKLEGLRT